MHNQNHILTGKTVLLNATAKDKSRGMVVEGAEFTLENWWDKLTGGSWMYANDNIAAMHYAVRASFAGLPIDNEVVYGKIKGFGLLVHESELGEEVGT